MEKPLAPTRGAAHLAHSGAPDDIHPGPVAAEPGRAVAFVHVRAGQEYHRDCREIRGAWEGGIKQQWAAPQMTISRALRASWSGCSAAYRSPSAAKEKSGAGERQA